MPLPQDFPCGGGHGGGKWTAHHKHPSGSSCGGGGGACLASIDYSPDGVDRRQHQHP